MKTARPNTVWSIPQINTIYSQLTGKLNGANLIGSCDWGVQAGLLSLKQTKIKNYISIATTHNLGWQHSLWPDYIA